MHRLTAVRRALRSCHKTAPVDGAPKGFAAGGVDAPGELTVPQSVLNGLTNCASACVLSDLDDVTPTGSGAAEGGYRRGRRLAEEAATSTQRTSQPFRVRHIETATVKSSLRQGNAVSQSPHSTPRPLPPA